ncbi:MAG: nuclear transport factor 2 family protein [Acidimicrobiales bacterium]
MTASHPHPAWAAQSGHVQLPAPGAASPAQVADRLAIAECIHRYGWGYDERDRDALGGCFTDDGVWEGTIMGVDVIEPHVGREAVVEFLTGFWAIQTDQRRHIFTNVVVTDLDGSTAVAHAYLMLTAAADAVMATVTTGPYRFEMRQEQGVWRMARLVAGFDAPF